MARTRRLVLIVLSVILLQTGCTSTALYAGLKTHDGKPGPVKCLALPAQESLLPDQLDVSRDQPTLERITQATTALRCLPAVNVPVEFLPADAMKALMGQADREQLARKNDSTAKTEALFRLMGWLEPTQTLDQVINTHKSLITGYYSADAKKMYVLADGPDLSALAQETIAHEWVHALQDARYDTKKQLSTVDEFDFDGSSAMMSLTEGDAVYFEERFTRNYFGGEKRRAARSEEESIIPNDVTMGPLLLDLAMPYVVGPEFVRHIIDETGDPPLERAYAKPPKTMTEILHPDLYLKGFKLKKTSATDLTATLGNGWNKTIDGTWGEFGTANFMASISGTGIETQRDDVTGWQGDKLVQWQNGGSTVAEIATSWVDPRSASAVAGSLKKLLAAHGTDQGDGTYSLPSNRFYRVSQSGSQTLIQMTNDPGVLAKLKSTKASAARAA